MKQHTTPCSECPFNRKTKPGHLGGHSSDVYVGQVYGPFFMPCHSTHDFTKLEERLNTSNPQCAGAAIHRSNIGRADLLPESLLHLPADHEKVFSTQVEFVVHHERTTVELAETLLNICPPEALMHREMIEAKRKAREGKAFVNRVRRTTAK